MQQEASKGPNLLQINQIGKMDHNGYSSQCKLRGEKKKSSGSKSRAKCFCFDLFSISEMFLLWGTICKALEIQKAHLLCTIKMCC